MEQLSRRNFLRAGIYGLLGLVVSPINGDTDPPQIYTPENFAGMTALSIKQAHDNLKEVKEGGRNNPLLGIAIDTFDRLINRKTNTGFALAPFAKGTFPLVVSNRAHTSTLILQTRSFSPFLLLVDTEKPSSKQKTPLLEKVQMGLGLPINSEYWNTLRPLGKAMLVTKELLTGSFLPGVARWIYDNETARTKNSFRLVIPSRGITLEDNNLPETYKQLIGFHLLMMNANNYESTWRDIIDVLPIIVTSLVYVLEDMNCELTDEEKKFLPRIFDIAARTGHSIKTQDSTFLQQVYQAIYLPLVNRHTLRVGEDIIVNFLHNPDFREALITVAGRIYGNPLSTIDPDVLSEP